MGLSPNAAGARVQRLVDRGVVRAFRAEVDHGVLGRPIEASVDIWQDGPGRKPELLAVIADDDRIIECYHPTGPLDYCMRVRVASPEDLADLLARLKAEAGVRQTDTRLILEQLPVRPVDDG